MLTYLSAVDTPIGSPSSMVSITIAAKRNAFPCTATPNRARRRGQCNTPFLPLPVGPGFLVSCRCGNRQRSSKTRLFLVCAGGAGRLRPSRSGVAVFGHILRDRTPRTPGHSGHGDALKRVAVERYQEISAQS